jgi:hypothetical protein
MPAAATAMSNQRKEAKKENKEHDKEEDENPTNIGPGVTESYDD